MFTKYGNITKHQSTDTGMALVLLCLLFGNVFFQIQPLNIAAIGFLIIAMSIPTILKPFAFLWFNFSAVLGSIVSRILLTVVFYVIVFPIGSVVRLFRNDPMALNQFKRSTASVFTVRDHQFTSKDIQYPY